MTSADEGTTPRPERVAARALVLAAVTCRGAIEHGVGDREAEELREQVIGWVRKTRLLDETEPHELSRLEAPLGSLSERDAIDTTWCGEGVVLLAWSLGHGDLPRYDVQVDSSVAAEALGFLNEDVEDVMLHAQLRQRSDLIRLAEFYFALHWRLRHFALDARSMDFEAFASECAFGPLEVRGMDFLAHDLAIDGRPLAMLDDRRRDECLGIARERQRAANWLVGQDPIYSEVTCDT
ncbi:MAG: DUF4272 domain-containing protein [Myxococcales bacterium]|nr:DUF4272 domain-containing protein [Myxococcales bacterium]